MRFKLLGFYIIGFLLVLNPDVGLAKAKPKAKKKTVPIELHPAPLTPPAEESIFSKAYIEETQKNVSTRVLRLADQIDSFFGDKRADDKNNTSTLRVSQRYYVKDGMTGAEDISATLNLYLPNLESIRDNLEKKLTPEEKKDEEDGVDEGAPKEENPWTLNQESGVVVANPINYFARLRLRRDFLADKFIHSFYEQVGWSKRNEWEEQTSLTSDYAINRELLFRFINQKDWAMTNNLLGTTHGPSLLQQISDTDAISYDFRFNTLFEGDALYGNRVSLSSLYRTQTSIKWIFLELNPEIAWERETHFHVQYNFYLRIELVFGNPRKN